MNSLNRICALAMCEQMESDLFTDETGLAIDMISGQPSDEEEDKDVETLHGSEKNMNEGFLDKFKKKKKESEKVKETPKILLTRDEIQKIVDLVKKELSKIVSKYNSDQQIKKRMHDLLVEWYYEWDEDEDINEYLNKNPKLVCNIFEVYYEYPYEISFEICDKAQAIRIAISDIIYDIANDLDKSDIGSLLKTSHIGDGDEGCIYTNINPKAAKEYLNGGN